MIFCFSEHSAVCNIVLFWTALWRHSTAFTVKPLILVASHHKAKILLVSSCSCLCPIRWRQMLSQEWRCSWGSADRWCYNYIWLIKTTTLLHTKVRFIIHVLGYVSTVGATNQYCFNFFSVLSCWSLSAGWHFSDRSKQYGLYCHIENSYWFILDNLMLYTFCDLLHNFSSFLWVLIHIHAPQHLYLVWVWSSPSHVSPPLSHYMVIRLLVEKLPQN